MATNQKFADKLQLDFPLLCDPERRAAADFGVVAGEAKYPKRWTFYIDKQGVVRFIDKSVKPASAGKDAAAKARELKLDQ